MVHDSTSGKIYVTALNHTIVDQNNQQTINHRLFHERKNEILILPFA